MPAEIVQLKRTVEEPRIWICAHCGCQHFMLYEDGSTECALCTYNYRNPEGGWIEQLKPAEDFDPDMPTRLNVPHGTADFARAAVIKSVDDEAVAVVIVWPDGRIRLWAGFEDRTSKPQQEWFHRTLSIAAGLAFGEKVTNTGDMPPAA